MAAMEDERCIQAIQRALEGHNLFISGQCGTGKTALLRRIIEELKARNRRVAVTASTGMAAIPLKGTTVHHWAGIGDNRYNKEKTLKLLDAEVKSRICQADVLVLDEIGMISAQVFDKVEYLVRKVRESDTVFGGLQIITSGDFKQLPPVPDSLHLDPGDYCFQANSFDQALPHRIILTEVKRQDEPQLVKAIKELCDGRPSDETNNLLKSLDRPISNIEADPVMLFGVNFDVDYMNQEKIEVMQGPPAIYKATDSGEKQLLLKLQAPKVLILKIGAPVILLKNLSPSLCNGTRGVVVSLGENPVIDFSGKLHTVAKANFDVFDSKLDKTRASRSQFPLKLAFALTVHKAQGQTIPYLEVDCFSFFAPGQLGVAIGRAVSLANLRVRNYNAENASLKHLPHVYEFYENGVDQDIFLDDLSCCHPVGDRTNDNPDPVSDESSVNLQPAATLINAASSLSDMPSCSDEAIFDLSGCPPPAGLTVQQQKLFQFVNCIYSKLKSILPSNGKSKDAWSNAYRTFHKFLLSAEYKQLLCSMFQTSAVPPVGNRYATKLAFSVHSALVAQRADAIKNAQADPGKHPEQADFSNLTESAKAKLRYIAGACLSQITTRLRSKALADVTNTVNTDRRRHVYKQQRLLAGLRTSESAIVATTSDPGSLTEINSKQSLSRGLFHVPDSVFHFFLHLHSAASKNLTTAYFNMYGGKTYTMCRENVFGDTSLISLWSALFPVDDTYSDVEKALSESLVQELYYQVTEHFIRISFVEALHEVKEKMPKTKKQALRAKIEGATRLNITVKTDQKRKETDDSVYYCPLCDKVCVENPQCASENSIGCDGCDKWFHVACAKVKNTKRIKKWFCSKCLQRR